MLEYFILLWIEDLITHLSSIYSKIHCMKIYWTLLQCFLQYLSGDAKTFVVAIFITIFYFNMRRFIGLSGIRLVTSLIVSVVNGRELVIASISTSRVCNDSSVRLPPWVFNKKLRIILSLWICHSQTPHMLLAIGGFLSNWSIPHHVLPNICWSLNDPYFEMLESTLLKPQ